MAVWDNLSDALDEMDNVRLDIAAGHDELTSRYMPHVNTEAVHAKVDEAIEAAEVARARIAEALAAWVQLDPHGSED